MDSALALASVTAVLKDLLENGLAGRAVTSALGGDAAVSTLPPDRVPSGGEERCQLNLFLYAVCPRQSMRLGNGGAGNVGSTLAVELHYLVSAYGQQDLQAEVLLGHALQLLHANRVIAHEQVTAVLAGLSQKRERGQTAAPVAALRDSDLGSRIDRLEVEPTFLSAEEISRLWSAFQAKYRPSASYRVFTVPVEGSVRS